MDFNCEESIFEVLNDNHEYFLGTLDDSLLDLGISPLLSPRSKISEEKFDFSDILNDDHKLYLDTNDVLPTTTPRKSKNVDQNQFPFSSADHLEYLSFIQKEYETQDKAAKKIQNCWRSYYQKQVYLNIKKLIVKFSNSDPALTLRIVNPKEAALLDKASGAFLKFKLAGGRFPPKIVYKIVSRTPIIKIDTILYQSVEEKSTMVNFDRAGTAKIIEKNTGNKKEQNDWRTYDDNTNCCNKKRRQPVQTSRSKSCGRQQRHKVIEKKLNELSWIKNQYGF